MNDNFPDVQTVMPHDHPMILLERILDTDGCRTVTEAVVLAGAPFVEVKGMRAHVTLEHMAQSVAAGVGVESRRKGEPPRLGFLVGCRELELYRDWIPIGSRLRIRVESQWGEESLGRFEGEVHMGEELIARADFSVVRLKPGEGVAIEGRM